MAIISLSIIESVEYVVAGIPRSVAITANMPCNIFYTLDGSTPDNFSDIYVSPIQLSASKTSITLKLFASDGTVRF